MSRSYLAIRREEGKPDAHIYFPGDVSPAAAEINAVRCFESEGYSIIGHEVVMTPEDRNCRSVMILNVTEGRRTTESLVTPIAG